MKERIQEIDIAKGIGILLVIIGHSVPYESILHTWIYSFHMPLFFILSGFVITRDNDISFTGLLKKNITLLSNYLFWSGVYIIFDLIVRCIILQQFTIYNMIWEMYQTITFYGINVLWFFSTLFIAKIIAMTILRRCNNTISILLAGILFVISVLVSLSLQYIEITHYSLLIIYPIVSIIRAIFASFFLVLGYEIKPVFYNLLNKIKGISCLTLGIFSIIATIVCSLKVGNVDVHVLRLGNPTMLLLSSLAGVVGVMCLSKLALSNRLGKRMLIYIGVNSSLIMVTHEYFKIKDLLSLVLGNCVNVNSNIYVIFEIILLIIIECCICMAIGKNINKVQNLISAFLAKRIFSKKLYCK